MEKFRTASLLFFKDNCEEHTNSLAKIKNYNFNENTDLIVKFLEDYEFEGGIVISEEDFKKYIIEGTFAIGIDLVDDINLDETKYIFDAFNVYVCDSYGNYERVNSLTKKWREIMRDTYDKSVYNSGLRLSLEEERLQRITEVNRDINNQIDHI